MYVIIPTTLVCILFGTAIPILGSIFAIVYLHLYVHNIMINSKEEIGKRKALFSCKL